MVVAIPILKLTNLAVVIINKVCKLSMNLHMELSATLVKKLIIMLTLP